MSAPQSLADVLLEVGRGEYVRYCAHWITRASDLDVEPGLTGLPVVDALVAATVAHTADLTGVAAPAWTEHPARYLPAPWYTGTAPGLNAWVRANAAPAFAARNLMIDAHSLTSV